MADTLSLQEMRSSPALDSPYTYFHTLFDLPGITPVYVISSGVLFESGVKLAISFSRGRVCHVLVQPAWHLLPHAQLLSESVTRLSTSAPNLQFTFMATTIKETECLLAHGLNAINIHKNAFLDDRIFFPKNDSIKSFAAVHVANTEAFKRHRLAWGIRNLALITYAYRFPIDFKEVNGYRSLGFTNISPNRNEGIRVLKPNEVADILRRSGCGVILSAEEGSNNASTEYLMCGIPVLSTPSEGGRDEFFDPRHVRIVQPNPNEIEEVVTEMNDCSIDPFEIHYSVMLKVIEHRTRLLCWLSNVTGIDLNSQADKNAWIPQFTNKLRNTVRL